MILPCGRRLISCQPIGLPCVSPFYMCPFGSLAWSFLARRFGRHTSHLWWFWACTLLCFFLDPWLGMEVDLIFLFFTCFVFLTHSTWLPSGLLSCQLDWLAGVSLWFLYYVYSFLILSWFCFLGIPLFCPYVLHSHLHLVSSVIWCMGGIYMHAWCWQHLVQFTWSLISGKNFFASLHFFS